MKRGMFVVAGALAIAGATAATGFAQQSYPARPIRMIIPYPPGGTSDILARLIGQKVTEAWKQQIIVDNRTGANGNIGLELTARATPDGYTMVLTDVGNAVLNSILYAKPGYELLKDFAPVTTVCTLRTCS